MFENLLNINCKCGKTHVLDTREFVVEKDGMAKLPEVLDKLKLNDRPLALYDENTYKAAAAKVEKYRPGMEKLILNGAHIKPDEAQIEAVAKAAPGHSAIVAVGSGVICDLARYVANEQGMSFVAVPTAASVDGFVSSSAVVTLKKAKLTLPAVSPLGVVADMEIISAAPKRMTASGVGDMLGKYIAIADWKVGGLLSNEYYCPFTADLELNSVDMIMDEIEGIARGEIASMSKLMEGLLISGIAMQMMATTRPASSFEHHISHYLETVPMDENFDHDALHGEKVGVASVYAAKYYPIFVRLLKSIFEDKLENHFSIENVARLYGEFPQGVIDYVKKENIPNISDTLDVEKLKQNYDEILETADKIPASDEIRRALKTVGGKSSYEELGINSEKFREVMSRCCYIRNRLTVLRLVTDYGLFNFEAMDD